MNVLVVSAHPDDDVLGAGGTLAKHTSNGDNVYSCVLSKQATIRNTKPKLEDLERQIRSAGIIIGVKDSLLYDFPDIRFNIVPRTELVEAIEKAIIQFMPEVIYTHSNIDLTDDHKIVFEATMTAIRLPERRTTELLVDLIREVLCFEIPSATDWSYSAFMPNVFVDIKETFDMKIKAIKEYSGGLKKYPHPRSVENLEVLARYRGGQSGMEFAESFYLVRSLR